MVSEYILCACMYIDEYIYTYVLTCVCIQKSDICTDPKNDNILKETNIF